MKLEQVADIISGRTFKHGIPESSCWTHKVVQLRDIDESSLYNPLPWKHLAGVEININRSNNELIENDILIVAKGLRKKAIHLLDIQYPTVPNQHFFIIRIRECNKIYPPFLRDYINSSVAQTWLNDNSVGNHQSTLSKKVLSQVPIPPFSFDKQKAIAKRTENMQNQISQRQREIQDLREQIDSNFSLG